MNWFLLLLSPFWLAIPWIVYQVIEFQGKMIGGKQFFFHMGMALGVSVQYGLAVAAIAIAALLILASITKLPVRPVVGTAALVFSAAILYTYLAVIAPSLGRFAYVHLEVFPPGFRSFPVAAAVLGFVTSAVASFRRPP